MPPDQANSPAMRLLVVVLAGGEGQRMGGGKPQCLLGGLTLMERAWGLASGWSDDVRVGLRSEDQASDLERPVLLDDPEIEGPLSALAAARAAAGRDDRTHILTIPCDMPFLPDDLVQRLASAMGERGVAVAAMQGQLVPVCALWTLCALEQLPAYVAGGRRSLKGLAQSVGVAAVDVPAEWLVNINTPEELAAAERRLQSEIQHVDH